MWIDLDILSLADEENGAQKRAVQINEGDAIYFGANIFRVDEVLSRNEYVVLRCARPNSSPDCEPSASIVLDNDELVRIKS